MTMHNRLLDSDPLGAFVLFILSLAILATGLALLADMIVF
jgi:hypothetical protein